MFPSLSSLPPPSHQKKLWNTNNKSVTTLLLFPHATPRSLYLGLGTKTQTLWLFIDSSHLHSVLTELLSGIGWALGKTAQHAKLTPYFPAVLILSSLFLSRVTGRKTDPVSVNYYHCARSVWSSMWRPRAVRSDWSVWLTCPLPPDLFFSGCETQGDRRNHLAIVSWERNLPEVLTQWRFPCCLHAPLCSTVQNLFLKSNYSRLGCIKNRTIMMSQTRKFGVLRLRLKDLAYFVSESKFWCISSQTRSFDVLCLELEGLAYLVSGFKIWRSSSRT